VRYRRDLAAALVIALAPALAGCGGGSPTSPTPEGPPLSERRATANFDFAWSAGDSVDTAWQEAFHDWATRELQVSITRRISYNKYRTPQHMLALHYGPGNVNAWADPDLFTLHTIWPFDNHEVIHLYTSTIGRAPPLVNEGVAVAYQVDPVRGDMTPRWNNRHVHDVAAGHQRDGRLRPLDQLLTAESWRNIDSQVSYPEAGSFIRHLLDARGGPDRIRALLRRSTQHDAPDLTRDHFAQVYGLSLDALEAEWLGMLAGRR
jgi:hypothetical protein